jgi:hypothetical protein
LLSIVTSSAPAVEGKAKALHESEGERQGEWRWMLLATAAVWLTDL